MLLRNKGWLTVLSLLSISSIIFIFHLFSLTGRPSTEWTTYLHSSPVDNCHGKLDRLADLAITYPLHYARRDIIVNPTPGIKRTSITTLHEKLFPQLQTIDMTEDLDVRLQHCKEPFILNVPLFDEHANHASHLMIGISTTLDRLDSSIMQLARWVPNTGVRLFAIIIESEQHDEIQAVAADPTKKAELQSRMRAMGMDVTLVDPLSLKDSFSQKYFSLIKIMFDHRDGNTQWIGTIDDDTFFPSIPALVSMLSKYDPQENLYIGGISEEWWSVAHYGLMGFGGAGIFLSLALAEVINENYKYCQESSRSSAGDVRIRECIFELTETKLTNERDLHQIDIHGDLSGLFESGRIPLSLHHWKPGAATTEGYDLPTMHLVWDICHDCFLQRWSFDDDLILSNGFSISQYPKQSRKGANMERMEQTWAEVASVEGSNNRGVEHSFGRTRPKS